MCGMLEKSRSTELSVGEAFTLKSGVLVEEVDVGDISAEDRTDMISLGVTTLMLGSRRGEFSRAIICA